ncbi:hypothetical protein DYBT9623_04409 [Dyadobacter sp. CECT 9623]|uniref:Uncharacterized protein n=1 Tax=Dyadobacter linearis TaxID=2823330 RepID=A0ABN7RHN9_9BACT|nr:hypothetical protein [Dyadobacter sp. CECT 9623]CAG5072869.1 hypothetical protein DYBT9623_04409 [Dyadobacter sp. CECT 9623]
MEENFDYIAAEVQQQQVLLDKGLTFKAGRKEYLIEQPYLGTLDYLAAELLRLDVDLKKLESKESLEIFEEQKRIVAPNARRCARIVAIAVLNKKWKIRFLTEYYAQKFLWSVKPSDLMKLTSIILRASNLTDFSASIALLSVNRTTAPQAIED